MNVSQFFCLLYILKCAHCLLLLGVIVIYIYIQKDFFARRLNIHKKKKPNHFYGRSIYILKPKHRVLSRAIKMESCIIEKSNNSIATKL